MAALTQARFAELQEWFYKAERSGVLSHDVAALGQKVSVAAPSPAELAAFKKIVTSLTSAKPAAGNGVDMETFKGAAAMQLALRGYQATRSPAIPLSGRMDAATWASLAKDQKSKEPDLDVLTGMNFRDAEAGIQKIRQKTAQDLVTAHGLWMKAREAGGQPVSGVARDPALLVASAQIESSMGDPRFSDNGTYFGTLQVSDKSSGVGVSWFAGSIDKTAARLNEMAKIAGPNADPALKGNWTAERVRATYKTNNYVQAAAYADYMSGKPETPGAKTVAEKLASSYLGHLLPVAKQLIDGDPNSKKALYALAVEKGKDPQQWAGFMIANSGVFMRETLKNPPNDWMKKQLGEYTKSQLSAAFRNKTLDVNPAKLVSDNPRQIVANAAHFLEGGLKEFDHVIKGKTRPANEIPMAQKPQGHSVAQNTAAPANGNTTAATGTTAPADKPLWRRALNSVGLLGKW